VPPAANYHKHPLDLAASWQSAVLRPDGRTLPMTLRPEDVRLKVCRQQRKGLIVFVVDASDSMGEGTVARIKAAKGALLGLLTAAYQMRDQVALVTFRGSQADVLLNPTSSVLLARQCLRQLRIGGSTPLADGLQQARQVVRCACQKQPGLEPLIVVISDGEANVPLVAGNDVHKELEALAEAMQREGARTVVIDSSTGVLGSKFLKRFSQKLQGRYHHVRDLHAGRLFDLIRKADPA